MLSNSEPVSFIATLDIASSRLFYEQTLGLNLISEDDFALVFDLGGHKLRVTKVDHLSAPFHTVFGWHVKDIEDTLNNLVERGIDFEIYQGMRQDKMGIWMSPSGAKVAWFKDPDGNTLSITQ